MNDFRFLRRSPKSQVIVVGDVMLDKFEWGRVRRISPEAPVPIVEIDRESYRLGGAANVACNIRELGATPHLVGLIGEDESARILRRELEDNQIATDHLISTSTRPTTLKTRIIASHQQVVRTDRESSASLTLEHEQQVAAAIDRLAGHCHALVLSDYEKGVLTPNTIAAAVEAANSRGVPVLVDPKIKHYVYFKNVTVLTPNLREAELVTGIEIDSRSALKRAADTIRKTLECRAVLITMGEHGMALFEQSGEQSHIPATAREVFDVTGAGDTVIATLAVALAAGSKLPEAARIANRAAGVAVGKLGTATVSLEELERDG